MPIGKGFTLLFEVAKDILFYGFFSQDDFRDYQSLPRVSQYTNLVLLPYNPNQAIAPTTFTQKLQQINKIIY